jgi:LEA14-like dessication related protein
MRAFLVVFSFFGLSAIMSCSSPKALEYRSYSNFQILTAGFNSSTVSLDLQYYNPNHFGMQLRMADIDIFINDNLLGHSSLDTLIQIPRKDTFTLPIKVDVDMHNIFKNALPTLLGREVTVKAIGRVKVGKANVFISMPVNYEGKHTFSLF